MAEGGTRARRCSAGAAALVTLGLLISTSIYPSASASTSRAGATEKSANVTLVESFRCETSAAWAATDAAFDEDLAFVAGSEGFRILDTTGNRVRQLGEVSCPGDQNDIEVVGHGLVALGYHTSQCGSAEGGVTLFDVSDPQRP